MLFNSYLFLLIFLSLSLLGYYLTANFGRRRQATSWPILVSLLFNGWFNPVYLLLILASILFKYFVQVLISKAGSDTHRKPALILGIVINIGLMGYFKYADFFVDNINSLFHNDFNTGTIFVPCRPGFPGYV